MLVSSGGARRGSCFGAAAWVLWVRDERGSFEKVSHGGRVRGNSAMVAGREALRMGIERLAVLLPTKVSLFDFEVETQAEQFSTNSTAQSPRLFGLHRGLSMTRIALVRIVCKIKIKSSSSSGDEIHHREVEVEPWGR